jgi:FixJ family two-component response regulator
MVGVTFYNDKVFVKFYFTIQAMVENNISINAKVFIVDDDQSIRTTLLMLFKAQGIPAQAFADAQSFLKIHTPDSPGCLLLDVRIPGLSGLDLQKAAGRYEITMPIILITGYGDIPMATQAMRNGAFDFIEKPFTADAILERIREALSFDNVNRNRQLERKDIVERMARLTKREWEVMQLVVQGMRNKEIGAALDITLPTVEAHRKKVMSKLEAKSIADVVRFWIIYESEN